MKRSTCYGDRIMFDLEKAIAEWRREVALGWTGDTAALDELEDHLREETAELVRRGNNEKQAWLVALAKLGDPVAVRREFAKIDRLPALDRWALIGFVGLTGIACVAIPVLFFGNARDAVLADRLLSTHIVAITLGYV